MPAQVSILIDTHRVSTNLRHCRHNDCDEKAGECSEKYSGLPRGPAKIHWGDQKGIGADHSTETDLPGKA